MQTESFHHNYGGKLPPEPLDRHPLIPQESEKTHPKKITETTLRDGAQDSRIAFFSVEARVLLTATSCMS